MFTSLRSRLWLSYAVVITIALAIVTLVTLGFLLRNPLASRELQQRLHDVQNTIVADPQQFVNDPSAMQKVQQTDGVRILVFNAKRDLVFDSNPNEPQIPFPRRTFFGRLSQTVRDGKGQLWLYTFKRVTPDRVLVIAAPRPRVPVLNIFTDQILVPVLEGGLIALLLSLILAYAISRWVADPLQQVVQAAQTYPSEDMKSIPPSGPHEVQDLT